MGNDILDEKGLIAPNLKDWCWDNVYVTPKCESVLGREIFLYRKIVNSPEFSVANQIGAVLTIGVIFILFIHYLHFKKK